MRIIAGEFRGRALASVGKGDAGAHLRPTTDRVRESLFNVLNHLVDFDGLRVLDLFAGSGALGAEALSRGAGQALLVEKKRDRCADLSRQLTPLFGERVRVHCADALKWLARCEERFDLVFIDPPYDLGLAAPACEALEALGLLKPDARIYVESRRHDAAPAVPESWERLREKDGGDVRAQLYRRP